ncbi:ATPase, F1 complex, OSCP/delta subunit [Candidatus Magnetoovum chiemensis]|nr:ATPase, F1 complex, OSCP/delta subunit [Candidatus Magnetoovum chiemensis]
MKQNIKLMKRYTKEIFKRAKIEGAYNVIRDLRRFNEFLSKHKDVERVFINPSFTAADRVDCMDILTRQMGLFTLTRNFLITLVLLDAVSGIPLILEILTNMYFEATETLRIRVYTPKQLNETLADKLKNALSDRFGKNIEINYIYDNSLIGGLKLMVGNMVLDTTIKGELRLLKDELIKG